MRNTKEIIEELRKRGLSNGGSLGYHSGLMDEAADLIEKLQKENEFHRETIRKNNQKALDVTLEEIEKAKSESAVKHCQKRGVWNEQGNCSECKKNVYKGLDADIWSRYAPPFCPNCGVQMEGVKIGNEIRKDLLTK